jgi:hypothetical protein
MQSLNPVDQQPVELIERFMELGDYIVPFAIRVIADLGVADCLAGGPRSIAELAASLECDPRALHRVLRALASKEIFTETVPGVFGLTPMADLLRSDHAFSLRSSYTLLDADVRAWASFDYSVRTGGNAFEHVHGCKYWEYVSAHPEFRARFDESMRGFTRIELMAILPRYDWDRFAVLVDVGGGTGGTLAGLLAAHPQMRGVLFDLPAAVRGAQTVLAQAAVAARCTSVAGSFFDSVPDGGDGYLLKRVLYSWDDEACATILTNIRNRMRPHAQLIIVDPIIRHGNAPDVAKIQDLLVLAVDQGHTRTRKELAGLLAAAGLRLTRMIPTPLFPITVAEPI